MDVSFETSNGKKFEIEIWFFSTVREIKEKIHKYHGFPISDQKLFFNGQELDDDRNTEFYDILQDSHLYLKLHNQQEEEEEGEKEEEEPAMSRPVAAPPITLQQQAVPVAAQSKGVMKVTVVPNYCVLRKIPVEVRTTEKVSELRKELQRLQGQEMNFQLPSDGKYFFVHKQNVMEDDRTFRWHGLKPGDTIDIFSGSIGD